MDCSQWCHFPQLRWTESLGWWQVMVCFVIGIYYAAIIGWAGMYTLFSINQAWGADPKTFLMRDFLHVADTPGVGLDFVPSLFVPILVVWAVTLITVALGVNKGLAMLGVANKELGVFFERALMNPEDIEDRKSVV